MKGLVAYCRPGYENDTGNELSSKCADAGIYGYPKFKRNSGFVTFTLYQDELLERLRQLLDVRHMIFPRQLLAVIDELECIDKSDRVTPIIDACIANDEVNLYGEVVAEYPDTEFGKQMAKFCRKFVVPLRQALRSKNGLTKKPTTSKPRLHAFFTDYDSCIVGVTMGYNSQIEPLGIYRLKFPPDAPSRSTLKLEEAIKYMLTGPQRESIFRPGARAVDLGACPGGWTYQLVSRGMHVEAIDNGAVADNLMQTGQVDHYQEDGFVYKPKHGRVELLVCDMIERPDRVAKLMTRWLVEGRTSHAIFNLKLPMKQRYEMVCEAINKMTIALDKLSDRFSVKVRHLYHDRDEITVTVIRDSVIS